MDIQLCFKLLTDSILISEIVIYKILKLIYFNSLDSKAECSDITVSCKTSFK